MQKLRSPHEDFEVSLQKLRVRLLKIHAPQTKMLEGQANLSECVFQALFNDS